jgi:hypothetical protein
MGLEKQSENVWTLSRPFRVTGVGDIGVRMTVMRLASNEILLISPVLLSDADVQEINQLGTVKYLIAPNSLHHLYIKEGQACFPKAKLAGPPGLAERRKDIAFNLVVSENNWLWKHEIEICVVKASAPLYEEVLFFHKKDKVLVTTDLVFNLRNQKGFIQKILARLNNTFDRFGMSWLGKRMFSDRHSLRVALKQISHWNPSVIIMAHGSVLRDRVMPQFLEAFAWLKRKEI